MSFFSKVDFKTLNLSISDFEHPTLQIIERCFAPIGFCLTTIAFVIFIYVAATQSPKPMKSYSLLLMYQICTTYVFDVLTIAIQPVILLPYIAAYTNGFWHYGERGNAIVFLLFILNIVILYHSFALQLIFRLASLYTPNSWIYKFMKLKFLCLFLLPFLIILVALVCRKSC